MNIFKVICIVFIVEVTEYTTGQRSDIIGNVLHNLISRQPQKPRFGWPPQFGLPAQYSVINGQQIVKRRLDRFRFFHKGIGKRSIDSSVIDTKVDAGDEEKSNILNEMETLLKKVHVFQEQRPYDKQYLFATKPDLHLENTETFRILLGLNYLHDKRSPESFSEKLYPIQAGKQQLEATLDKTLDRNVEYFGKGLLDYVERRDYFEENATVKPEIMNNTPLSDKTPARVDKPFDLIFASPDLDTNYEKTDRLGNEGDEAASDTVGNRSKRWWAAKMFNKFRSPKSWNRKESTGRRIDPALYFIGLGK